MKNYPEGIQELSNQPLSSDGENVELTEAPQSETPWLGGYTLEDLAAKQRADSALLPVIKALEEGEKPSKELRKSFREETQSLVSRWQQLRLRNDVLYRCYQPSGPRSAVMQLVLPAELRLDVLHQLHDLRVTGHLGIQRTVARVQQRFYWPGFALDVARWCAACPQCAGRKGKPTPGRHPLVSTKTGAPFDRIALDILDTKHPTPRGYKYILVISDSFTKFTDAFPLRRHTAEEVAKILVTRWVVYHGVPKQIFSDQGTEFESVLFRSVATLLGCIKSRTSPYHPQADGQVERFNRSLLNMLSGFVNFRANDWDQHLPLVCMAYRSSVHSSTNCTPQVLVYGRELNLPVDIMYPSVAETDPIPQCGPEYVEWLRQSMAKAYNFVRAHLDKSAVRQKRGYDAHAKQQPTFKIGDKVRYYYPPVRQGNKFARPWIGPFTIMKQVTEVDYRIKRDSNPARILVTHIDNLKPFEGPLSMDPPLQMAPPDDETIFGSSREIPTTIDDGILHVIGVPTEPLPVVYDDSDEELGQMTQRPRRKGAGVPPQRLGYS